LVVRVLSDCTSAFGLGSLSSWLWGLGCFAAGMTLYKLRQSGIFNGTVALIALTGLIVSVPLRHFIALFPLFGCYLTLYLARHPKLPVVRAARFGDLSYGLYMYGWPAEQLVIWLRGGHAVWWQVFLPALSSRRPTVRRDCIPTPRLCHLS
jgi:hypothetical protein